MGRTKKLKNPKATTLQLTDEERRILAILVQMEKKPQSEIIRLAIREMGERYERQTQETETVECVA